MLFFSIPTGALAIVLLAICLASASAGLILGRRAHARSEALKEPFAVLQAAMLGFMGLVLAFGLSLALGRYEGRRAAVVDEANAIGTSYLRAQTLAEPYRSQSLALFLPYTDLSIKITDTVPGGGDQAKAVAASGRTQGDLWAIATKAMDAAPVASAPRLYLESLNDTFDSQSRRIYGLTNRVPTEVLLLEVFGAAIALGALGLHLGALGRGAIPLMLTAVLVTGILTVTFDLDRPTRGAITVPDTPLVLLRASMGGTP